MGGGPLPRPGRLLRWRPLALAALAALIFLGAAPLRAEGESGSDLAHYSGSAQLRDAIWRLAAFVPAGEANGGSRRLKVDNIKGLPPVSITVDYGEPLDPWPRSLELVFQAEAGRPKQLFTVRDQRPFGGPNIEFDGPRPGPSGRREAQRPLNLLLDILDNLNARLLAGRPRLAAVEWSETVPGFEIARTSLLFGARLGPDDLYLLRFSPDRFTFRPYHESEYPDDGPAAIGQWADRLGRAAALVNGGQYYPDRSYMGRLERDGRLLSAGPHPKWKGFAVSGLRPEAPAGAPAAAVIDLDEDGRGLKPEFYQNVMQSFMLLDHKGLIRVRESRNLAGRTALGEDGDGRLILIMTPSAISLYDFATALKAPALNLARVMSFDGGFEAQLFMRRDGTGFVSGGQFSISDSRAVYIPGYHPALPAVLAVEALPGEEEGEGAAEETGPPAGD